MGSQCGQGLVECLKDVSAVVDKGDPTIVDDILHKPFVGEARQTKEQQVDIRAVIVIVGEIG